MKGEVHKHRFTFHEQELQWQLFTVPDCGEAWICHAASRPVMPKRPACQHEKVVVQLFLQFKHRLGPILIIISKALRGNREQRLGET